jgi:hypothetical protein
MEIKKIIRKIKILDSDNLIKLVVISNKKIKKGEILQLNKNIILNIYINY